jgi:uncharacterized protein
LAVIRQAIIDTGPLVAFLDRDESHHEWSVEQIKQLAIPLLVCEPVLTEAMYLLARIPPAQHALLELLQNGALQISFSLSEWTTDIKALLGKYADQPMSLADACLVKMSELNAKHYVFTLDSDFRVYRKHGREPVKLISPGA